jgi:hypothetical protein
MTRGLTFCSKHANFRDISKNISFESEKGRKVIQKARKKIFSKKIYLDKKNLTCVRLGKLICSRLGGFLGKHFPEAFFTSI